MKWILPYLTGYVIIISFSILFVVGVFYSSIENNPIKILGLVNFKSFMAIPQGWAFFTRNPKEAQVILYKITDQGEILKFPHKHSSHTNLFGLNRKSSKILTELQLIKAGVEDSMFLDYQWNYQNHNWKTKLPSQILDLKNEVYDPVLCGSFIFVLQKPVTWAWSKSIDNLEMPAKVVRLNITCDETPPN